MNGFILGILSVLISLVNLLMVKIEKKIEETKVSIKEKRLLMLNEYLRRLFFVLIGLWSFLFVLTILNLITEWFK